MSAPLTTRSSVCVLVPHFGCEAWLAQAIESVLGQTRPPEAVVVIDDGSPEPPVDVVADFPEVTLLAAPDNAGPYRLVQAVIDRTECDAYLFQDADDWSAPDRLEVLLREAEATGAELIGSHEARVLVDEGDVVAVRYPLDVNAALDLKPTAFPLLHPTSLVARTLVTRLGGFATGMRFSGDAEFLRRAGHAARVVNADHVGYFRRKRAGSLTTDPATALQSDARRQVQEVLARRALANAEARTAGRAPDLRPWKVAPAPELRHLSGPPLGATAIRRIRTRQQTRRQSRRTGGPVVIIGAPRCGQSLLGWALGQHPELDLLADARWLGRAAADVVIRADEEAAPVPARFTEVMAEALREVTTGDRWIAAGTELTTRSIALATLFPEARFVHLVRDVEEVVASIAAAPTEGGTFYTPESAYRSWSVAARAGADLEQALGPDRVLRLLHSDLVDASEGSLRRALDWLGLSFDPACLRPLTGLEPTDARPRGVEGAAATRARALWKELLGHARPDGPDEAAAERLRAALRFDHGSAGGLLVEKVRAVVARSVPEGSVAAVVSRGDPRLVDLPERIGWHFPQVEDGTYAGHHPATSDEAVSHLENLRTRGAEYLVFPSSGLWWLSHYEGFRQHLTRYPVVAYVEDSGAVFRLTALDSEPGDTPAPAAFTVAGVTADGRPRLQAVAR